MSEKTLRGFDLITKELTEGERMKEALLILKDFEGCLIYTKEMEDVVRWGLSEVDELPKVGNKDWVKLRERLRDDLGMLLHYQGFGMWGCVYRQKMSTIDEFYHLLKEVLIVMEKEKESK